MRASLRACALVCTYARACVLRPRAAPSKPMHVQCACTHACMPCTHRAKRPSAESHARTHPSPPRAVEAPGGGGGGGGGGGVGGAGIPGGELEGIYKFDPREASGHRGHVRREPNNFKPSFEIHKNNEIKTQNRVETPNLARLGDICTPKILQRRATSVPQPSILGRPPSLQPPPFALLFFPLRARTAALSSSLRARRGAHEHQVHCRGGSGAHKETKLVQRHPEGMLEDAARAGEEAHLLEEAGEAGGEASNQGDHSAGVEAGL